MLQPDNLEKISRANKLIDSDQTVQEKIKRMELIEYSEIFNITNLVVGQNPLENKSISHSPIAQDREQGENYR